MKTSLSTVETNAPYMVDKMLCKKPIATNKYSHVKSRYTPMNI